MHMYGKCGLVEDAKATFNQLPNQDSYSWNILINLCGHNHGYEQAKSVFNMMPSPNVVSWNALMTLLIKHEQYKQALEAFSCMQNKSELPNEVTLICATDACSALRSLQNGLQLHVRVRSAGHENKIVVGTSLINMYGSCGCLQHVKSIFNNLSSQDVVSWTAMIGCLSGNGCNEEALELFKSMQSHKIPPNDITFICVMEACAESALLKDGMDIHTLVIVQSFEYHVKVCNALIDMYGKCGSLQSAWKVFKTMGERTLVTWNAMIVAFGQHGAGEKAMTLFWKMQRDGLKPDGITFTALMNACSHAGLVQDGWLLFHHVHDAYRYAHESDQYICIIDLLGRAGRLEEAEEVILKSPARSELVAWLCLLAACKLHGDVDRGLYAASCCFKFDKTFAAPYIVLSNIYMELLFSEP
ncbi:hypothetical protein KP509_07G030200 [Ceratopteris richardii]|nr:hypothetical protein KP509_07G030200 [Ceratopteris richardii]